MKGVFLIIGVALVSLGVAGNLSAQETLIETVANGCKTEITTYCKDVKPGEGRILACLYAYEDKLSGKCEYALYDAAARLERAVAALTYVAKECEADIVANCSGVKAGEGRVLQCLEKNEAKVSTRCKGAIRDVGLK
jgi:Cysteine rich repeat